MFQRKAVDHYQYNLQDIIGRGFSSIVYQGIYEPTNEPVAIKVIQRQFSDQMPAIQNEISVLSQLQGPNILKLYGHFYTQHNMYIITELCKDGDLAAYLNQTGPIPEETAIGIVDQVIEGLLSMNRLSKSGSNIFVDIIHRDLKPSNLLRKEGQIKIADFGFAKPIHEIKPDEMNVGTPLYMSPETITLNIYRMNSDVWSLGVLFYEILFGVHPWQVQTEAELVHLMTTQQIKFPVNPKISSLVRDFILRCLTVNSTKRPQIQELKIHPLFYKGHMRQISITEASPMREPDSKSHQLKKPQRNAKSTNRIMCEGVMNKLLQYAQYLSSLFNDVQTLSFDTPYLQLKLSYLILIDLDGHLSNLEKQVKEENIFNLINWEKYNQNSNKEKWTQMIEKIQKDYEITRQMVLKQVQSHEFRQDIIKTDYEFLRQLQSSLDYKILLRVLKYAIVEHNHILIKVVPKPLQIQSYQREISTLDRLVKYYKLVEIFKCGNIFNAFDFYNRSEFPAQPYLPTKTYQMGNFVEIRQSIKSIIRV